MKTKYQYLIALFVYAFAMGHLGAEQHSSQQSSHRSVSKSVSVTSDGEKTVKKTVIIRDGVKEVIIETTGKDGKKTVTKEGGKQDEDKDTERDQPDVKDQGPWLGVRVKELSDAMRNQLNLEEEEGVEVDLVAKDSPATAADIRVGDIILSLAGNSVATPEELSEEVNRHQAGDTVKLAYMRRGQRHEVDVTLQERPKKKDDQPKAGNNDHQDKNFDAMLNDPNLPENFKKKIREMQKKMTGLQEEGGG